MAANRLETKFTSDFGCVIVCPADVNKDSLIGRVSEYTLNESSNKRQFLYKNKQFIPESSGSSSLKCT